jgi:type II secretory pathway component GspD/PulD (secretin)
MKNIQRITKAPASAAFLIVAAALLGAVDVAQSQVVNNTPTPSALVPNQQQVEVGPILDVVPYVLSDGYTINLTLIPSLTEFDGYDPAPVVPGVTVANVVSVPTVLPKFSVRQVITTVNIWDNQTIVLGGLVSSQIQTTKDTVPFLGDLPGVGKLFQSQSKVSVKKNLMIFVTATIIDPAGNRVHSDDELPFTQTAVPAQPPGAGVVTQTGVQSIPPPFVK